MKWLFAKKDKGQLVACLDLFLKIANKISSFIGRMKNSQLQKYYSCYEIFRLWSLGMVSRWWLQLTVWFPFCTNCRLCLFYPDRFCAVSTLGRPCLGWGEPWQHDVHHHVLLLALCNSCPHCGSDLCSGTLVSFWRTKNTGRSPAAIAQGGIAPGKYHQKAGSVFRYAALFCSNGRPSTFQGQAMRHVGNPLRGRLAFYLKGTKGWRDTELDQNRGVGGKVVVSSGSYVVCLTKPLSPNLLFAPQWEKGRLLPQHLYCPCICF